MPHRPLMVEILHASLERVKESSIVDSVPGTDPPEPFTLQKFKEVSGFGYSRIYLYLIPDTDNSDDEEMDHDSLDDNDIGQLPPVTWLNDLDFQQSVSIDSAISSEPSSSQCSSK